jgi:hypothetical protein
MVKFDKNLYSINEFCDDVFSLKEVIILKHFFQYYFCAFLYFITNNPWKYSIFRQQNVYNY